MKRPKTPDEQIVNNRYSITAEIIQKGANGDLYVRRSIQDYRINIEKSTVSVPALQQRVAQDMFAIKLTTMEIGYTNNDTDSNENEIIIYTLHE